MCWYVTPAWRWKRALTETDEAAWDYLFAVNVKAVFLYAKYAIPHLRDGGGSIINLGSISATVADPGLAAYNASKAAVLGLTRSIAAEYGRDNIRCNAICPGWIETDMLAQTFAQASDPVAARAEISAAHPLGRLGTSDDIAAIAAWLASDESAFASGQTFTIDGGLTATSPVDPNRF